MISKPKLQRYKKVFTGRKSAVLPALAGGVERAPSSIAAES
jgi:hypothetical protein